MEFMSLAWLIKYSTPGILFALIILVVVLMLTVRQLRVDITCLTVAIEGLRHDVVWKDVYAVKVSEYERRISRLEVLEDARK